MAGPFGFDAEKYEVSLAIGERVLLPAVRSATAGTLIVSDGFSCRERIGQGAGRKALHLADVLARAIGPGRRGQRRGNATPPPLRSASPGRARERLP